MVENEGRDELFEPMPTEAAGIAPMAIGAALGAGILGAVVWAGIAIASDFEIGWIAWGIGAAVGGAFVKLGGRGAAGPFLCALIAFASIFGGKYAAFQISVSNELESMLDSPLQRMGYESAREFGSRYAAAKTDEEREQLAREHIVYLDEDPGAVSELRLQQFREHGLPTILSIHEGRMSFEEYKASFRETVMAEVSFSDALGLFDLLWIFLGVGTAFQLAAGKPRAAAEQSAASRGES
ncbi:MAG: hypothetical protein ACYTEG_14455 [Planctomycetota bacterium]|jgi:hypothetical protein